MVGQMSDIITDLAHCEVRLPVRFCLFQNTRLADFCSLLRRSAFSAGWRCKPILSPVLEI